MTGASAVNTRGRLPNGGRPFCVTGGFAASRRGLQKSLPAKPVFFICEGSDLPLATSVSPFRQLQNALTASARLPDSRRQKIWNSGMPESYKIFSTMIQHKTERALADFLPTVTIAAKNLAPEMTNCNAEEQKLQGEAAITQEHVQNNESVRSVLVGREIVPENLPPEEDIKKLERKVKNQEKKLSNAKSFLSEGQKPEE